jgi:hypothetical protein
MTTRPGETTSGPSPSSIEVQPGGFLRQDDPAGLVLPNHQKDSEENVMVEPRRRGLPTFEDMRVAALRQLGDALDVLRSDWRPNAGPTGAQLIAVRSARLHVARAKAALDRAAALGVRS